MAPTALVSSSTTKPVTPSSINSGTAPRLNAITGAPQAMASIMTSPKGSGQSIGTISAMARLREFGLLRVGDLPNEFDIRFGEKRLDHLLEIVLIDCIDFGRDLERQSAALGDVDRAINPLLRRNATQKSEIGRVRRDGLEEAVGHPVMNRADPMRIRHGPPLGV